MADQKTISPIKDSLKQAAVKAAAQSLANAEGEQSAKEQDHVQGQQPVQEPLNWYAIRAFKRKVMKIKEDFEKQNFKTYMAMRTVEFEDRGQRKYKDVEIIPQLLFVCCSEAALTAYKSTHDQDFMIYKNKYKDAKGNLVATPAPIPEAQMKAFIFITSTGNGKDIEYFGDIMPHFEEGSRVRVTDGIYKGATGFVKRSKRDRKLLVAIEGVAVVAISNIPMSYLQKI